MKKILLILLMLQAMLLAGSTLYIKNNQKFEPNMRATPNNKGKYVGTLQEGDKVEELKTQQGWTLVSSERLGKRGWVISRFTTTDAPLEFVVDSLNKANENIRHELDSMATFYNKVTTGYKALESERDSLEREVATLTKLNVQLTESNWKIGIAIALGVLLLGYALAHIPAPQKKRRSRYH